MLAGPGPLGLRLAAGANRFLLALALLSGAAAPAAMVSQAGTAVAALAPAVLAVLDPGTRAALDNQILAERRISRGGFGAVLFNAAGPAWSYTGGVEENLIPFTLDTPLMAGDLSGRMVILAAARLAHRGLLDLDRPLRSYLPELAGPYPALGNLAGLAPLKLGLVAAEATGRTDAIPLLVPDYRLDRDLLPALDARAERYPAGFRQSRSCGMVDLLALVLERTRRQPWRRVVAAEALRPLGMVGSTYLDAEATARTVAFFHADGQPLDPRLVAGMAAPLAPSLSLRTTLGDLAACGSGLLAGYAGAPGAPLPWAAARAVLGPAIPGQLDRQGCETGLGWNLTDYRLGYLGRVAWTCSQALTHQTLVVLLPDRGLGAALAQTWYDPAAPSELRRIARSLLGVWAEREQGAARPEFQAPSRYPPIPEAGRPAPGLYASPSGLAVLDVDGDLVLVSVQGGFGRFYLAQPDRYLPAQDDEFAALTLQGDTLTLFWRSGARISLDRVPVPPAALPLEPGGYPVEVRNSVQGRGAAMILQVLGHWTITADDGRSYLLAAAPDDSVRVLCDPSSMLYGCRIQVDAQGAQHILAPSGSRPAR